MSIQNQKQLEVIRQKLNWLEQEVAEAERQPEDNPSVQQRTLRSLRQMINQTKEEIIRFQSRTKTPAQ